MKLASFFKSEPVEKPEVVIFGNTQTPEKAQTSMNDLVDEIHDTFFTEVDRLLAECNVKQTDDGVNYENIKKADILSKYGFVQSDKFKRCVVDNQKLDRITHLNEHKTHLANAINYFSQKYPHYKFITEGSVIRICEKYGLIYGSAKKYIGDIPDKNIEDIANFKIDECDEAWYIRYFGRYRDGSAYLTQKPDFEIDEYGRDKSDIENARKSNCTYERSAFEIAAPKEYFQLSKDDTIENNQIITKIQIPDPVVLCPVMYGSEKYYLIVTAWGNEASDKAVVNQKMN